MGDWCIPPVADHRAPSRVWRLVRLALGVAFAIVAVRVVAGRREELEGATQVLAHLRWSWVVLAAAVEITSVVAFAEAERRMLAAGGLRVGLAPLSGIALAGNAVQNSLPGGVAWASVFAYRQFKLRGADDVLAAWTMAAVEILSAVSLTLIAGAGVVLAHDSAVAQDLVGAIVVVLILAVVVGLVVRRRGGNAVVTVGTWVVRVAQRVARRPRGDATDVARRGWERLTAITPSHRDWALGLGFVALNWFADCGCLALSFRALGAPVPWRGLLLAYGAAQMAANLPFTPGGLGVVEGSLAIALVAYGNSASETVAAVLLYRVVSFWAMLPVGWAAWAVLTVRARRQPSMEPDAVREAA